MALKSLWLLSMCCHADYCDAMNSTLWDFCAKPMTNTEIWLIGQHNIHICYPKQKYVIITVWQMYWSRDGTSSIWHTSPCSKSLSQTGVLAVAGYLSCGIPQSVGECHANVPTLGSLQNTTKHHSLWPCLSESFPATYVLLPTMSSKVINNGPDLNWLLWN